MDETMVTVTIGGEAVPVPPMSFAALKRAWPVILSLPDRRDAVAQAEAVVAILAAALARTRPDLDEETIAERLIGAEFLDLLTLAPALLKASGLVAAEAAAPGEVPPATGTPSIG